MLSVALIEGEGLRSQLTFDAPKSHGEQLVPLIDRVLGEAGIGPEELDAVAVSHGPGSFTGLRIGLATAKALAFAAGRSLFGVSTLQALAHNLRPRPGLAAVMLDARRGEVYAAMFRLWLGNPGRQRPIPLLEPSIGPHQEWLERARRAAGDEPLTFLGDGAILHQDAIRSCFGDQGRLGPLETLRPRAGAVADLGRIMLLEGRISPPEEVGAVYLQPSQAELIWERKNTGDA